ncbi:hypothetical protein EVAR_8961_1 [Eumeta japonica]|uniref:Uncharacterized protein n=1 Tax=Eumeta variegata TaxID=151549 RepID=A0A4C1U0I0_EUMVA|nr:hypothetical protein EVAR_8961_1 [Eumeta japonica]
MFPRTGGDKRTILFADGQKRARDAGEVKPYGTGVQVGRGGARPHRSAINPARPYDSLRPRDITRTCRRGPFGSQKK